MTYVALPPAVHSAYVDDTYKQQYQKERCVVDESSMGPTRLLRLGGEPSSPGSAGAGWLSLFVIERTIDRLRRECTLHTRESSKRKRCQLCLHQSRERETRDDYCLCELLLLLQISNRNFVSRLSTSQSTIQLHRRSSHEQ